MKAWHLALLLLLTGGEAAHAYPAAEAPFLHENAEDWGDAPLVLRPPAVLYPGVCTSSQENSGCYTFFRKGPHCKCPY